jgi:hypothetical protein
MGPEARSVPRMLVQVTFPLAAAAACGRLRRNFQGYVASDSPWVVGVGASAISSLPRGFTQNVVSATRYVAAVETGGLATARGLCLSDADRLRGEIIDRLMCLNAADIGSICQRHQVRPAEFLAGVDALSCCRATICRSRIGAVRWSASYALPSTATLRWAADGTRPPSRGTVISIYQLV